MVDPELELARMRASERLFPADTRRAQPRYRVLECVGRGAMGVVYAAYDAELDRRVALKLVGLAGERADGQAQRRLVREAQALARLSHPNVVTVHDAGSFAALELGDATALGAAATDDGVFIAMEFVTGMSLRQWSELGGHGWREALDVVLQAGRGLAAVHRAGMVHRDIKPDNVMIDAEGRARVMDFGLVRAWEAATQEQGITGELDVAAAASGLTGTGAMVGTPAYMAPELLDGGVADMRSDQFAFAVTLWEVLYGVRPFVARSVAGLVAAIHAGPVPPADARVPGWLRSVVARGLDRAPERRWPSIDAMLAALLNDPSRRRRRIATAVAVVGVAAAIGAGMQLDRARRRQHCADAGASISEVWNDDTRAAVRAAIAAAARSEAAVEFGESHVVVELDRYAEGWRVAWSESCNAADLEGRAADLALRADACLATARDELAALSHAIATGPREVARDAAIDVWRLPATRACNDPQALAMMGPPAPATKSDEAREATSALVMASIAREPAAVITAIADVEGIRDRADELGVASLRVDARDRLGKLLLRADQDAAAAEAFEDAARVGIAAGIERDALPSMARLVTVAGANLVQDERALAWAGVALALAERVDPDGVVVADVLSASSWVHLRRHEYPKAIALLRRADEVYERIDPEHPDRSNVLTNLGIALYQAADVTASAQAFDRAVAIIVRMYGPDSPRLAKTLANGASAKLSQLRHREVLDDLERALAIMEREGGGDGWIATILSTMALVEHDLAHDDRALVLIERSLAITERTLGPDSDDTERLLFQLGDIRLAQGRLAEAHAAFVRAEAISRVAYGATNVETLNLVIRLAKVELASGEIAAARAKEAEIRRSIDATPGLSAVDRGEFQELQAAVQQLDGDHAEAMATLQRAREGYSSAEESFRVGETLLAIAATLLAQGDGAAALRFANEAHEVFVGRELLWSEQLGQTKLVECRARAALDQHVEAERACREALAIAEQLRGPMHPSVGDVMLALAELEHATGDRVAARRDAVRALEIRTAAGQGGPWRAEVELVLAEIDRDDLTQRRAAERTIRRLCSDRGDVHGTRLDRCPPR